MIEHEWGVCPDPFAALTPQIKRPIPKTQNPPLITQFSALTTQSTLVSGILPA